MIEKLLETAFVLVVVAAGLFVVKLGIEIWRELIILGAM